jgi:hypothetical protein
LILFLNSQERFRELEGAKSREGWKKNARKGRTKTSWLEIYVANTTTK